MLWKRDVIYGVIITFFGVFMIYHTSQVPLLGDVEPIAGARYYLYPWFALMFILGVSLFIQGLLKRKHDYKEANKVAQTKEEKRGGLLPLPTMYTLTVLTLYAFFITKIGYQISTTLFLFCLFIGFFLFCQEEKFKYVVRNKKKTMIMFGKYLLLSIAVVVFIQIIFGEVLDVRLPG